MCGAPEMGCFSLQSHSDDGTRAHGHPTASPDQKDILNEDETYLTLMRSNAKRLPGISTASFNAFLECLRYMIAHNVSALDWTFVAVTKSASGCCWLTDVHEQTYGWGLRSKSEKIIKFGVRYGYNPISTVGNSTLLLIAVPSTHPSVYF